MSRGAEYKFIPTDPEDIIIWLTAIYEEIMGVTVQPASPERHFIQWMAEAITLERVLTNYTANQNIPSRAVGNVLKKLKGSDEERKKGERKGRKGNGNEDIDNKMSALRE